VVCWRIILKWVSRNRTEGYELVYLDYDRKRLPVPLNVGNLLTNSGGVNLSRRTLLHGVS
jgi:hypothetical protein